MGSAVQTEILGATIVSSSSNLYYLLWATALFGSVYVVMSIFRNLSVFNFFGSVVSAT